MTDQLFTIPCAFCEQPVPAGETWRLNVNVTRIEDPTFDRPRFGCLPGYFCKRCVDMCAAGCEASLKPGCHVRRR